MEFDKNISIHLEDLDKNMIAMQDKIRRIAQWQMGQKHDNGEREIYIERLEKGYDEIEKTLFGSVHNRKVEEIVKRVKTISHYAYTQRYTHPYIKEQYIYYPNIKEFVITGSIFADGYIISKITQKLRTKKRGNKRIKMWSDNSQRYDAIYTVEENELEMIEELITYEIAKHFKNGFRSIYRTAESQKKGEYAMPVASNKDSYLNFNTVTY